MAGITIKRELRLSFAPSNTAIFSGFRQPFSNTNEARVPPAHWIMLGQNWKRRKPSRFCWGRNLKVRVKKWTTNKNFQREWGQQVRKEEVVNQWVMADKSNWREDKEATTGRACTKKLDIKGVRFINQWGVVGKSIHKDKVVRTGRACSDLNKKQGRKLETQLEWELWFEIRKCQKV